MEAATQERADETTANEDETKTEEQRLEALLRQVEAERKLCADFMEPKRAKWLKRLKLYNNQARDESKVGDPMLFTVFQTVFAALYDDRLSVEFEGNDEGDKDTAENLTDLAEHDYRVMHKAEADYEWDWDACFFGRGLVLLNEFDRTQGVMAPVAEVIDPVMWLRDPRATSVNGDQRGRGAMRFGGREISLAKWEMETIPGFKNLDQLKKAKEYDSVAEEAKQARREAQGTNNINAQEEALDENYEYTLLEWFTTVRGP